MIEEIEILIKKESYGLNLLDSLRFVQDKKLRGIIGCF